MPCPHCHRKFGKKAIESHINFCRKKVEAGQRDIARGGGPGGGQHGMQKPGGSAPGQFAAGHLEQ